jgi:tight adherence protein B
VRKFVLSAALAVAVALPAVAAAGVQVTGVDASNYPLIRVNVVTSSPAAQAPLLREDGTPVLGVDAQNLSHGANVVLAIDRSRSMAGQSLTDAAQAARSFVAGKPRETRVEIVAFGKHAVELTGMSPATIDADQALLDLGVDKREGTALWDAVVLGSRALAAQTSGGRVLVLLTDGANTSNTTSLNRAIAVAHGAGVAVYPIGIESSQFSPAPLRRLASETGGSYHAASSSAVLQSVYSSLARELERTWRISYPTTARPGDSRSLDVTAVGLGGARATLNVSPSLGDPGDTAKPSSLVPAAAYDHGLGTLAIMLVVGLATLCAFALIFASTGGRRLKRRLAPHIGASKKRTKVTARDRLAAADGFMNLTEQAFARFTLLPRLQVLLGRADLPLRAVELFYICIGAGFVPALLLALGGAPSILLLFTMAVGGFVPVAVVSFKAKRRLRKIDTALPDLLITLAASLKAGHSFRQGIQATIEDSDGPLQKELRRVLTDTSLGRSMDHSLLEMAERVGSEDLKFVITAVTIQSQVGGSLAGIFDLVADTIRQRQQFARKIRSLTAMGRMSAYTLVGLPFFLAIALTVLNRDYMAPLYDTSAGHELIMLGLGMMIAGSAVLRKIVSFRG